MKKFTSLAAALCLATAFCGMCAGCATNAVSKELQNGKESTATVSSSGDYKLILNPGWYYDGGTKKSNTLSGTGITALTEEQKDTYHVENGYAVALDVGAALPTPTGRTDATFKGWRRAENGELVTYTVMPNLSADMYLYAEWVSKDVGNENPDPGPDPDPSTKVNGLYVNGTLKTALSVNSGVTGDVQYWLGGVDNTVALTKGDTVTFYIDEQLISAYIFAGSAGVDKPSTSTPYTEFTITVTGEFKIYLTKYADTGSWVIEFGGPTELGDEMEIPATAIGVNLNFSNGTVRLYVKEGNSFVDPKNFYFHIWEGGLDTKWPGLKITENLDLSGGRISSSVHFILNKNGSPQTSNLSGIDVGTYVVTFISGGGEVAPGRVVGA